MRYQIVFMLIPFIVFFKGNNFPHENEKYLVIFMMRH
jgi:hypothetical protein